MGMEDILRVQRVIFSIIRRFNMSDVDSTNIVKVILPLNGELREYFDVEQIVLELVKK